MEFLLQHAIATLEANSDLDGKMSPQIIINRTRESRHGDFSSNLAMVMAKQAKSNPRLLAEKIIAAIPDDEVISKIEIAGPGFINFFIKPDSQYMVIREIHDQGRKFGRSKIGNGKKVQVEFVSANPTGPLHVGHGRGAAYGSVIADLLEAIGYQVDREYYVNDSGRQMDILATSVWLRYLEECGEVVPFPGNGYRGEYIREIAWQLHKNYNNEYRRPAELVTEHLPPDEPQGGDKEEHIDALIERAKTLLGALP